MITANNSEEVINDNMKYAKQLLIIKKLEISKSILTEIKKNGYQSLDCLSIKNTLKKYNSKE